ncbi:ribonuclease H-like protein [Ceratocystis lukuohia]|uniref:Mitochondrial resolvase Ydc2 / RNA splicing MRS1 n=2 Tax=Ceratocystis TaxID=5157 RepID=A0A0F8BNY3_CERFI|nr:Mitochondrial resolvase Ydc2 / RNA splicing MRS1 [Ceratocystis platani]
MPSPSSSAAVAAFQVSSALTIPRLRRLAFHVGSQMTARKAELKAGIEAAVMLQAKHTASTALATSAAAGDATRGTARTRLKPDAASKRNSLPLLPPPHQYVVVSIDMGIRNFAICVLGTGVSAPQTPETAQHCRAHATNIARPLWLSTPQVLAWRKYDLLELFKSSNKSPKALAAKSMQAVLTDSDAPLPPTAVKVTDFATADIPALAVRVVRDIILPLVTDAATCAGVVCPEGKPLVSVRADRVLIEHQRHHSRGLMGVLHTTVLVNSLEVSLHTLLEGMREFAFDPEKGGVVAKKAPAPNSKHPPLLAHVPPTHLMDPRKVSEFWVRDIDAMLEEADARNPRSKRRRKRPAGADSQVHIPGVIDEDHMAANEPDTELEASMPLRKAAPRARLTTQAIKRAKVNVLTNWLEAGALDLATPEAKNVAAMFLPPPPAESKSTKEKRKSKAKTKAKGQESEPVPEPKQVKEKKVSSTAVRQRKIDDLADCLLQGLYALRIDENRRAMLTWGVEPFLDE